jgi:hypothetical protein
MNMMIFAILSGSILISATTFRARFSAWFAAITVPVFIVSLIVSLILSWMAIPLTWKMMCYGAMVIFFAWQVFRCLQVFRREKQKSLSIQEKARMWKNAASARSARPVQEVIAQIKEAVEGEGHAVAEKEVRAALVRISYPRASLK